MEEPNRACLDARFDSVESRRESRRAELEKKPIHTVKQDLIKVLIMVLIICGALAGLKILDIKTGYITSWAEKIASHFIK